MKQESGFIRFEILMMIMVMSLGVLVLLSLVSSGMNHFNSTVNTYKKKERVDMVFKELTFYMQYFCDEEADVLGSKSFNLIGDRFSDYHPIIKDVSSGINVQFLNEALIVSPAIQDILAREPTSLVNYGWIPVASGSDEAIDEAKVSFGCSSIEELFPLVNYFPAMNIHFISKGLLEALLTALKVPNPSNRAEVLFGAAQERPLQDEDIIKILGVKKSHPAISLLGVKTAFWKVILHVEGLEVHAVYAAIPSKRDNPRQPEKYVLVERRIVQ